MTTGPHILIVDDDTELLKALTEMLNLRMSDLVVQTTESGSAAIERIMETDFDAIVSDIKMAGMDGLTLLERIRTLRPEIPILLITGHGEHDLAIRALRNGAYDYIQKPFDRDYIVASLKRALQLRQLGRLVEDQRRSLERYANSLERMVEERTEKLVEANRVKDEFLSIASHELRSPLITLRLYMQLTGLALEKAGVTLPLYWDKMGYALAQMETLVNELVDAVRITAGKLALRPEGFDVRVLCSQVANDQDASTGRNITVRLASEPLTIEGDVDRLGQVLTNLLANAVHYSPPGSPVVLSASQSEHEILITVTDQGIGIPAEHLPHIFERFYQAPSTMAEPSHRVGLGLGLFICRDIVERHGGRVWAESTVGQGSRFTVALPPVPTTGRRPHSPKNRRIKEPLRRG